MGISPSTEKPDYMSYMARLSLKDYKNDEKFWTELLSLAPSRIDVPFPYPRLMNEIAVKFPQNFLRLVLICVQHVNLLKDGVSVSIFPDMILDQFFLSMLIFDTCFEALIYNEKLIPILNRLDSSLAQIYIKARPHLESYISLSQKRKQEHPIDNQEDSLHPENEEKTNHLETNQTQTTNTSSQINPIFASMQLHEGHVVNSMISCLSNCMFKAGLTLENEEKDWNQSTVNYKSLNISRRDIIHCIYFLNSLDYFLPEKMDPKPHFLIEMPEFPFTDFLKSMCIVATKYHLNSYQNINENETFSLLQNCLGFIIQLFNSEPLATAFSQVDPLILLQAFILKDTPEAQLLFHPSDLLANETLTFLYTALCYQPNLSLIIANEGLANKFIFTLIEALQLTFESVGVCYLHSIIISTILLLVSDETIASLLNNPFNQNFVKSQFRPHSGSYADVLLEVLFNLCDSSSYNFAPAVAAVFQMIVPQVQSFSIFTAEKIINLFDNAIKAENQKLIELLLEAFAEIVQNKINNENLVPTMIIKNASLFQNLKENEKFEFSTNSLDIIFTFISYINDKLSNENLDIKAILESPDVSKIFTNVVSFMKHPQILNEEITASWTEWSLISFKKSFEKEFERFNSLKVELNMQDQQIQFMMKQQQQIQQQQQRQQQIQQQQEQQDQEEQDKLQNEEEKEKEELEKIQQAKQEQQQNKPDEVDEVELDE
ncbi:hypothetical protein M9Y10_022851 [Tritrichomonas musculus]|uniref:Dymeclin n=1 Tax=Tritrichomonas musculus TaxID=1915356 RepID=A0ABR2KU30_9EUKA